MTETDTAVDLTELRRAKLADWERRATPWLVVSAILPIIGAFSTKKDSPIGIAIGIATWLVFAADLGVHMRLAPGYLRTRRGMFDLTVVLITFPWYLITGGTSGFVTIARLARIARLAVAGTRSRKVKHLLNQLGNVAIYAGGLVLACAVIVKWAEPPSSGFTTYGDAIWWGFVTITTVGYGDLYPVTAAGRVTAVVLMLGGVAFLGTLAGTLSAFFGVGSDGGSLELDEHGNVVPDDEPATATAAGARPDDADVAAELAALRATVDVLVSRLDGAARGDA
ncbi:MAG TPA: ion transporter [Candidatus Nanopelagicales bacterium]